MRTLITGIPQPHPALIFSRAERDQAVIFDPACAPLFRPLIERATLQPWHTPTGDTWLLSLPPGYSTERNIRSLADLIDRHPGLRQRLSAYASLPDPHWWELPPAAAPALQAAAPRILLGDGEQPVIAWEGGYALASAPIRMIAPADHVLLALVMCSVGRRELSRATNAINLPVATASVAHRLAELTAQAVAMAQEQQSLAREFARRLLADFGPPGSTLTDRLRRWWELEFPELLVTVQQVLRNPIPAPFQPFWAARHAEGRARYYALANEIAAVEAAIDELAIPLWQASSYSSPGSVV